MAQINNHLDIPSQSQVASSSVISDIVLGAHSVPKPVTTDIDRRYLCRSQAIFARVVGLQKMIESTSASLDSLGMLGECTESNIDSKTECKSVEDNSRFNEAQFLAEITSPVSSITIQRECKDLKIVEDTVKKYTSHFATVMEEISTSTYIEDDGSNGKLFVREFSVGETCNLLAQLQASSLRVHSKKDWYNLSWKRDLSAFAEPISSPPVDAGERKSDFEIILDQLANVFSLSASFSDPTVDVENNEKSSSTLSGIMWDEKTMVVSDGWMYFFINLLVITNRFHISIFQSQFQGMDSTEGRYIPVGLTGAIGVVCFEDTYQSILTAMSLRDYISTVLGTHLPLFVSSFLLV